MSAQQPGQHKPVLLNEAVDGLDIHDGNVVIDGTLGRGGHSAEVIGRGKNISIIGIDRDDDALSESKAKLDELAAKSGGKVSLFKGNFRDMDRFAAEAGAEGASGVDKIILDLGISSPHLDSSGRGFSFKSDEPLLMTMEKEPGKDSFTARDIVNGWAEEDIANVIYAYGEERYARRIARKVVEAREAAPIETTHQLVSVIESAVPGMYKRGKIHPATRTFQALRIAVNDELGSLKMGLRGAIELLRPGGRLAVISFHSLEDRIVKTAMRDWQKQGLGAQHTKKPIVPTDGEIRDNPRSRSAKLRIFIKKS